MTGGRRSATVRADGAAVVSVIARREFLRWLGDHPEVGDDLAVQARHRIDASQVATMAVEVMGVTDPDRVGVGGRPVVGDQEPPQRRRVARAHALRAGRAVARAVQG